MWHFFIINEIFLEIFSLDPSCYLLLNEYSSDLVVFLSLLLMITLHHVVFFTKGWKCSGYWRNSGFYIVISIRQKLFIFIWLNNKLLHLLNFLFFMFFCKKDLKCSRYHLLLTLTTNIAWSLRLFENLPFSSLCSAHDVKMCPYSEFQGPYFTEFTHFVWMQLSREKISVFSRNAGKY